MTASQRLTRKVLAGIALTAAVGALINTVVAAFGWARFPEHIPMSVGVGVGVAAICGWLCFALFDYDGSDGDRGEQDSR